MDHGPIPPLDLTPHSQSLAGQRFGIDTRRLDGVVVFPVDEDGEILPLIPVEVEVDSICGLANLRHHAFDELVAAGPASEALHIVGSKDTIGPDPPCTGALRARIGFAREKVAHASMVVGEGVDSREPFATSSPCSQTRSLPFMI